MSSCEDKLDADRYFGDRMTIEKVFADRDYSERWLSDAYSHLVGVNADVSSKGFTMYCFADDMYFGDRDDKYKNGRMVSMMKDGNKVHGENAIQVSTRLQFLYII